MMDMHDVRMTLTLANRITIVRFLSIPVFVTLVIYYAASAHDGTANEYLRWAATLVFAAASLSDALDGYFARSRRERTRLGAILDPLADKTLLVSALILLSIPWGDPPDRLIFEPHIPLWYTLLVISRDAVLIIGSMVIHFTVGHLEVGPRWFGKASTVFQMLIIVWVLTGIPGRQPFLWLLILASACTLLSAAQYLVDGIRQLERAHAHEQPPRAA